MAKNCSHKNPLERDGTSRSQRQLAALAPDSVQLDDRSTEDLLQFAYRYAAELKFFELDGSTDKNWQIFFEQIKDQSLAEIESRSDNEPHFALFLCFLKLFQHAQGELNKITERHLDFYYRQILQIKERAPQEDQVHLICELAKNVDQVFLPAGTLFNGGKDESGQILHYLLPKDTLVNSAAITHLRSVYAKHKKVYFATQSNSADGLGEEFEEEHSAWSPFGHTNLPRAAFGFAIASPVLLLQEGKRKIKLLLNLTSSVDFPSSLDSGILSHIKLYASGEEDWIGPFTASDESVFNYDAGANHPQFNLTFDLSADDDAIVPYNPEMLSGNFDSLSPLIRVVFEPMEEVSLFFDLQTASLRSIKIEVEVEGMKEMHLENDYGTLDGSKSFMPFGPRPVKGSNFFIGSDEAFTKKLKNFKLNFEWLNRPRHLTKYYAAYNSDKLRSENFTANLWVLDKKNWGRSSTHALFRGVSQSRKIKKDFTAASDDSGQRLSKSSKQVEYLKTKDELLKNRFVPFFERAANKQDKSARNRTAKRRRAAKRRTYRQKYERNITPAEKDGFIKLSLNQDFGHQLFPTAYTLAIAKNTDDNTQNNEDIPNDPYTPTLESIQLDYVATTEEVSFQTARAEVNDYRKKEIQFFHITPFGQAERHPYLNAQFPFATSRKITLLPAIQEEGNLYMGLARVHPGEHINLLLQLAEGSADPDKDPAAVHWHCLVQNQWMPLGSEHMLADHTNGLLTSGLVTINIPKEANTDNSILEEGFIWIRASVNAEIDSVAKFVGVHAQAIRAELDIRNNSLEHLSTSLAPETIGKMINRQAAIKKITQPYASFGGAPREDATNYYNRVSERLRHKNRAITIWDYEHLVLEAFPSVYKVKCLNHSSLTEEIAPGQVMILVIPNLRNKNASDPLRPKIPSSTLAEIEAFLSQRASRFALIQARNPDFEEIRLQVQVTFRAAYEEGYYKKVLNEDLLAFFTPWAFDESSDISFGGHVHQSQIINFLEHRPYVQQVDDLKMFHVSKTGVPTLMKKEVSASNSRAILVSAKQHTINPE